MIFIKAFLLFLLSIVVLLALRYKVFQKIFIFIGYIILIVFILEPSYADKVASFFHIKSGTDLIVYLTLAFVSYLTFMLYIAQLRDRYIITKIVRHEAIKEAKHCGED